MPPRTCLRTILLIAGLLSVFSVRAQRFFVKESTVDFVSEAPLETIRAASTELKGVMDLTTRTFAFSMPVRSFRGFNSELQQEHFHENYVESEKYPVSTFTGKIIDDFNPEVPGIYAVRAKGQFMIRGISRERILKGTVQVKPGLLLLKVDFDVLLDEYSIRIPRLVYQKIAPEIKVSLNAVLAPRTP